MDRESFWAQISDLHHEAEAALVRGDVGPRLAMWSHHDPVSLFGAVGVSKTGWADLEPTFRSVARRLAGGHDVVYELMSYDVRGDTAWTAGFIRFVGTFDGGPQRPIGLRITHVYRREAGAWKVAHEHSDFLPSDEV